MVATRRRTTRRTTRRTRRRPARRTGKARTTHVGPMSAIADRVSLKFRYHQTTLLNTGVAPVAQIFRGNSMFDPDFSLGGHTPLSFDQWKGFFNRYLVHGVKYSIRFINQSQSQQCLVAVLPKDESTIVTLMDTILERPYTKRAFLGVEGGNSSRVISGYMSTKRILGLTQLGTQNTSYSAPTTTNPIIPWFLHCYAQATDRSSVINVRLETSLTFYTTMYDRVPLGQSA